MLRITLSANGSLSCCSDGVRGRGAAVTYLSHNASFHSKEKIAPSNRGIKHLVKRGTGAGLVIEAFKTLLGIWTLLQVFLVSARTYNGTAKILGADCKSCPGCRTRHKLEFATLPG